MNPDDLQQFAAYVSDGSYRDVQIIHAAQDTVTITAGAYLTLEQAARIAVMIKDQKDRCREIVERK